MVKKPTGRDIWFKDLFGDDPQRPRSKWWWVFVGPGKIILWFEYMFPKRFSGVFGSARRKQSPIVQVSYSILFYIAVIFSVFIIMSARHG